MKYYKYRVQMTRHGTVRDTTSAAEAIRLCRLEMRDGWPSHVWRLADNVVVFPPRPPRGEGVD